MKLCQSSGNYADEAPHNGSGNHIQFWQLLLIRMEKESPKIINSANPVVLVEARVLESKAHYLNSGTACS